MITPSINHLAVIAAAFSTFILGGLWYSPLLFGKAWQKENNLSEEDLKNGNMLKIFGISFLCSLIMAYNLAFFLNASFIDAKLGTLYGFATGFGFVALSIVIISLFERKNAKYILINGGYLTVAFSIMGLIIGGWK